MPWRREGASSGVETTIQPGRPATLARTFPVMIYVWDATLLVRAQSAQLRREHRCHR